MKHKKKHFDLLYKLLFLIGAIFLVLTFVNTVFKDTEEAVDSVVATAIMTGVEVSYNDTVLGIINTKTDQTIVLEEAFSNLSLQLGRSADIDVTFKEVSSENLVYSDNEEMISKITDSYMDFQSTLKQEAVKLSIDDTELILSSRDDVIVVLEQALEQMINSTHPIDVQVVLDDNQIEDIQFTETEFGTESCETELCSINMIEEINLESMLVFESEIQDVDDAVDFITKLKDKPVSYEVVSGDVPSTIAEKNNMRLSSLYDLNPDLEDNETSLQIGEDLIVTVPEPEMSIEVVERIVYDVAIPKSYTYTSNPNEYMGTNETTNYGADGVKEITATVTKVNGLEIDRVIESEVIIKDPISAVISKGIKALPSKGATGTFISPLTEYNITSYFGPRWNASHRGIDMAANYGSSVRASDGGVVTTSGWHSSYGNLIEIDHGNGIKTRYAHNSKLLVSVGDYVSQYQEIAKVGSTGNSTGPHVHFEIIINGSVVNPLDYIQ